MIPGLGLQNRSRVWCLLETLFKWAKKEGWTVVADSGEITEQSLGTYAVEVLHIQANGGRLHVEPIAQSVPEADGRVDLYAFPSLHRVRLLKRGAQWVIRTESGIDWPKRWNEQTFIGLAKELAAA